MRGERVAQGVPRSALWDSGTPDGILHGALQHGPVEVVAAALTRFLIDIEASGRKDPLPRPLASGVGVLVGQCPGQLHPARAALEVDRVLPLDDVQMRGEVRVHDRRQWRGPVLVALSRTHGDLVPREIDVLQSEPCALEETEPGSVEQDRHEAVSASQLADDGLHLVSGNYHDEPCARHRLVGHVENRSHHAWRVSIGRTRNEGKCQPEDTGVNACVLPNALSAPTPRSLPAAAGERSWGPESWGRESCYLRLTHLMRRQPLNRLTLVEMSGIKPTCSRSGSSGRFDFQPRRVQTGETRSSKRPTTRLSLRKWFRTTIFPPGLTTRRISRSTPTGSGTALMV